MDIFLVFQSTKEKARHLLAGLEITGRPFQWVKSTTLTHQSTKSYDVIGVNVFLCKLMRFMCKKGSFHPYYTTKNNYLTCGASTDEDLHGWLYWWFRCLWPNINWPSITDCPTHCIHLCCILFSHAQVHKKYKVHNNGKLDPWPFPRLAYISAVSNATSCLCLGLR